MTGYSSKVGEAKLIYSAREGLSPIKWEHSHHNTRPGPEVIKLFPCSAQLSMKFLMLISIKNIKKFGFFRLI